MTRRELLFRFGVVALPVALAAAPGDAREEVIDFEQAAAGVDACDLYRDRGVTFSTHPVVFETPKARSGRHALRPRTDSPTRWVTLEFAEERDVRRVVFFVGLADAAPGEQVRVVVDGMTPVPLTPETPSIRLPSAFERQSRTITGGPGGGPTAIDTRFELSRKPGQSPITQVRITPVPPPHVIVLDDLTFEARSPRPRSLTQGDIRARARRARSAVPPA